MKINSVVKDIGAVALPTFGGDQLYMHPVDVVTRQLPAAFSRWEDTVSILLDRAQVKEGIVYLTIDEKELTPGKSHRRGGAHVDGVWIPEMSAHGRPGHVVRVGGWEAPTGRWKEASNGGGLVLLSSVEGCKAWAGEFEGEPGVGGDLEHIRGQLDASAATPLRAGNAYLLNVWGVHESVPVTRLVQRSLVRLTLPESVVIH